MKHFAPIIAVALAGYATAPATNDGLAYARIGETAYVDGPEVTPLALLEDSRCPSDAQCVWAGRVRISARIDLGSASETHELTLGTPLSVADGSLELRKVTPPPKADKAIAPSDYRFGFRFMGGL